jgi:hypothetical protein
MKKTLLISGLFTLCTIFCSTQAAAQPYVTALGIRLFGTAGTGISLQQRLNDGYAIEGIAQQTTNTYQFSALAKVHNKVLFSRIANYYFGIGGQYGGYYHVLDAERRPDTHYYGVAGMIGTELTLARFNISFDYMPSYWTNGPTTETLGLRHDVALSLRFVLIKPKKTKGLFDGLDKIFKDMDAGDGKKKDKTKEM